MKKRKWNDGEGIYGRGEVEDEVRTGGRPLIYY
jgi:hypothetical protein